MIYLDNAATTKQKPKRVIEAVVNALENFGNASRGIYDETLQADRMIFETRLKLCNLFHASNPRQVVFTKNSTESLNIALHGLLESGDHVITTVMEHNSVLRPLHHLSRTIDLEVDYVGVDAQGELLIDEIETYIKPNTKLMILTHASNVTGNLNDLIRIGEICKKNHLLLIVDASQTAGAFEIDLQRMNIDVLCFTGHKSLLAPQGTGGLCVKEEVYIKPFIVGGTGVDSYNPHQPEKMPSRLEAGTQNAHSLAGLHAALDYLFENDINELTKKAQKLAEQFYQELKDTKGLTFYGNYKTKNRAPIVSLNVLDEHSGAISDQLYQNYQISTRSGAHCAPMLHEAMHTKNQGMVRFSFSHANTMEEVYLAAQAIKDLLKERKENEIF